MSNITAYSTISSDINFTLISTDDAGSTINENSSIDYSFEFTNGSGLGQVNYAVSASGTLNAGTKYNISFQQFPKTYFGLASPVNFSTIKGIIIQNRNGQPGNNLNLHATGTYAFTGIFNANNSGNYLIRPSGSWIFNDVMSGVQVTTGHHYLTLSNPSSTGIDWRMIVVGTTGNITGNFSY